MDAALRNQPFLVPWGGESQRAERTADVNANIFDLIFIGLIVLFFLLSYMRGVVKELFTLLGLVLGFWAASTYADDVAVQLRPMLPDHETANLLSFLLIMLGCYFVGIFLGGVSDLFRQESMGPFSRMLGGLIGLGKGVVLSLAVFWIISKYLPAFHEELGRSWMGARLENLLHFLQQKQLI